MCHGSLIFFILSFVSYKVTCADYYFDCLNGDDEGNSGLSSLTPWRSLSKANSLMNSLSSGDSVRFLSGCVFNETLSVAGVSGNDFRSESQIHIGVYCTTSSSGGTEIDCSEDDYVTISGRKEISNDYSQDDDILEFDLSDDSEYWANEFIQVFVDGVAYNISRYPHGEKEWLYISNTTESSSAYMGVYEIEGVEKDDIVGSRVVMRTKRWAFEVSDVIDYEITSYGALITLKNQPHYKFGKDYGYKITNKKWMLESGDWCFDNSTQTLYIKLEEGKNAQNVKVEISHLENGIVIKNSQNVCIENFKIVKVNQVGILCETGLNNVTIQKNQILYPGYTAIQLYQITATNIKIDENVISDSGQRGIYLYGSTTIDEVYVRYNTISNTMPNPWRVLHQNWVISGKGCSIQERVGKCYIENNTITNSGYVGLNVAGETETRFNYVNGVCSVLDDCGMSVYKQRNVIILVSVLQNQT